MELLTMTVFEQMKQELKEIEQYTLKYTLADAIREGSIYTEQCRENWYSLTDETACALSAAFLATSARVC